MSKIIDLDTHLALTTAKRMEEIIKPLKEAFDIKYFRYLKLYHNGARITLSNYPDWIRYVYELGNYQHMWLDGGFKAHLKEGWCYRPLTHINDRREVESRIDYELTSWLGMTEGFGYIEKGLNFYEVFFFDSDNPLIYNIEQNLLLRFVKYFRDEASDLIASCEEEKLILPGSLEVSVLSSKDEEQKLKILEYLDKTKVNRYYLGSKYQNVYLTEKQARCIYWLMQGKTAEEIALIEKSSVKTIQAHLDTVKVKLNCQKQTQIIKTILESGLLAIL